MKCTQNIAYRPEENRSHHTILAAHEKNARFYIKETVFVDDNWTGLI
jgi:hypothetical protein